MAEDKKIKIVIGTEADTSGADKAAEALQKVQQAAATQPGGQGAAAPVQQAAAAMKQAADEIDQSAVRIIDNSRKVREAVADDGPQSTPATPAAAAALKKIEDEATAAAEAVDRARKAAEQAGPLTELQKLEFELKRITEEAKVLDAALEKVQRRQLSLPSNAVASIANRVNQADIQVGMLQPQIEVLQASEAAARAEAEAQAAAAKVKEQAAEASKKLREETRATTAAQADQKRVIAGLASSMSSMSAGGSALISLLRGLMNPYALLGTAIGFVTGMMARFREEAEANKKVIEDAENGTDQWAEATEKLRQKAEELRKEQARQDVAKFVADLNARITKIDEETKAFERQLTLRQALRRLDMETKDAEAEVQLATIDEQERTGKISPVKAIQQRATVTEQSQRRRAAAEIAEKDDQISLLQRKAADAQQKAELAAQNVEKATAELEAAKKREMEMRSQEEALNRDKRQARALRDQLEEVSKPLSLGAATGPQRDALLAQQQREIDTLTADLNVVRRRLAQTAGGVDLVNGKWVLQGRGAAQEEVAGKKKALDDKKNEAAKIATEAQDEAANTQIKVQEKEAEKEAVRRRTAFNLQAISIRTGGSIGEVQRREAEKRAKEAEREAAEKERLDREAAGLGDTVSRSANQIRLLNPAQKAKVRQAAESLRDGVKQGEASGVAQVLAQVLDLLERAGQGQSNQAIDLEATKRRLDNLEAKFRTGQRGVGK